MMMVAVYNYWKWRPGEGLDGIAPEKRSLESIEAVLGIPIRVTRELVALSDVDADGRCQSQPTLSAAEA